VLLESMKDHFIPHIIEKTFTKEMYDALEGIYQKGNTSNKFHLKHHIQVVKMYSKETIVNYLMNIS
jgi:hypothetical protein